jgi:PEGA domain
LNKKLTALGLLAIIIIITNFQQGMSLTQQPGLVIKEDTPVRLRLMQTITSATAKVGDKVDFEVIEGVKIGDTIVIPQGETAIATVTKAETKKSFGRSGKLNVNIDYVRLANGEKAALRAVQGGSGGSRTGVMTGAAVATAIIFFPAAPLFFFMKGKNITIPKGTEITAYVAADTPTTAATVAGQTNSGGSATAQTQPSADAALSAVVVKSSPEGAEITVDGKFMGTTQSTLRLSAGEHTVRIEKSGYREWARTITLSAGGNITIDAALEKKP